MNELFMKLLEECHNRGIYPDGKISFSGSRSQPTRTGAYSGKTGKKKAGLSKPAKWFLIIIAAWGLFILVIVGIDSSKNGYYRHTTTGGKYGYTSEMYYRHYSHWYRFDPIHTSWKETSEPQSGSSVVLGDMENTYLGNTFDTDWNINDFQKSEEWKSITESHSSGTHSDSSSDYDSWDSDDTDWDSDW